MAEDGHDPTVATWPYYLVKGAVGPPVAAQRRGPS